MSKEIVIPDYLKEMMAVGAVEDTTGQMNVAGGGVARLTTKGKTFRFKDGDDEVKSGQSVDLIIIGLHPAVGLSHTYYADGYTPDSNSPPDCSSMGGMYPDSWITKPVNRTCLDCPNQVWGSAQSMSGGKAKACRDSKQLYVAKAADFAKDAEKATLYLLQVTVNSLKSFSNYGKELHSLGFPGPQFVITRVSFDEEASVPKLEFECLGPLNEKLGPVAHARSQKQEWDTGPALPPPSGNSKRALPSHAPEKDDSVIESTNADLDAVDTDSLINRW